MKTKLSFLALPSICLGIALILAISACTSDSSPDPAPTPGTSSAGGGGGGTLSSKVESGSLEGDFALESGLVTDKVLVSGKYSRVGNVEISKMEITPSGWVTYKGSLVTGPINFPAGTTAVSFGNDTYIDLNNAAIKCGSNDLTIKVCIDAACSDGKWAGKTEKFEKPQKYCNSSSSQGGGAQSSSSAANSWKFGNPTEVEIASLGEWKTISGTSISFALLEGAGENTTMPDIEVKGGGGIRPVVALGGDDDDVVPGKVYGAYDEKGGETLGDKIATSSRDESGVTADSWFLIYAGKERYLLHFQKIGSWSKWPKKCTYWTALESPQ